MSNKPDGGPAFPRPPVQVAEDGSLYSTYKHGQSGMSLRDWLAGQALAGMLSYRAGSVMGLPKSAVAQDAWDMADVMLAERVRCVYE